MTDLPPDLADLIGPPQRRNPNGGRTANPHRDALYVEQARIARLKADKLSGELVAAADVEREWAGIVVDVRAALLAVPSRVGARLGLSPAHVAELDAEIRAALAALGAEGEGGAP